MSQDDFALVCTHLEFVGHTLEIIGNEEVLAKHPRKTNAIVKHFEIGIRLMSPYWTLPTTHTDRTSFLEALNQANFRASIAKYFAGTNDDLYIVAWFLRGYERISFGEFLDLWDADTIGLFYQLELKKYVG